MATQSRSRLIRRIVYVLVGIVIVGFIVSRFLAAPKGPEYITAKAEMGDVQQTVALTGTTEPKTRYQLQFAKSGTVGQILVQVGSVVKQGDVLAVLKNDDARYQLDSQKAVLHIAQANLAKAVAGKPSQEVNVSKLQIDLAQAGVDGANASRNDFNTLSEKTLNSAYIAEHTAKTSLDQAQDTYNYTFQSIQDTTWDHPSNPVYDSGYYFGDLRGSLPQTDTSAMDPGASASASTSSYGSSSYSPTGSYLGNVNSLQNAEFAVQKAQEAYDQAKEAYDKAVADLKNQTDQLDSTVTKANISLQNAKEQYNLTVAAPRDVDIAPLKAQVDQAWTGVNLAQYQLDQTELKSPTDGIVTDIASDVGETAGLSQPFITVDSKYLYIKALVSEADIAKIKVGQDVDLTFDAFGSDQAFKGNVYEVDPSETIVQGVVYYVVKVQFDANNQAVKPGMTANLTIHSQSKSNILEVPARAIQYDGNQAYVQVLKTTDNKQEVEQRDIQVGLQGDENVEVVSGLENGEDVVTFTKTT